MKSTTANLLLVFIILVVLLCCEGCGASFHLKRAKYHELKAESLGATIKEKADTTEVIGEVTPPVMESKTDTVYVPGDTLTVIKDNIIIKTVIKPGQKIYIHAKAIPPKVKYVQRIVITKKKTISAGWTNWQYYSTMIGGILFGVVLGALLGRLLWRR